MWRISQIFKNVCNGTMPEVDPPQLRTRPLPHCQRDLLPCATRRHSFPDRFAWNKTADSMGREHSLLSLVLLACVCVASAVHYDLSHLTEPEDQWVVGPIQDDEALLLYSIIRGMRLQTILEIGGKSGYSAKNFVRAISHTQSPDAKVFTVDIYPVPKQAQNHIVLTKNASNLTPADVENRHIDLLFFDCHDLGAQMNLYNELQKGGVITDDTVVAVHDTNLYYYPQADGTLATRAHQGVERDMVNWLKTIGYDAFSIRTSPRRHSDKFPRRHGISILQKSQYLVNPPDPTDEARESKASWATVDMARAEREIAAALQKLQPAGKASGPHTACQPSSAAGAGSGGLGLRGTNLLHTALVVSLGLAVTGPFWAQPLIR